MVQHDGLVDGAGVVVQAPGDGQVHHEVVRGHAEGGHVLHHGLQLGHAQVEELVLALEGRQGGHGVCGGEQAQQGVGGVGGHGEVVHQDGLHLLWADLLQLVDGAHHVARLRLQAQQGEEAVEHLPVVHPDLEPVQAQGGEGLVDDGGDLRLVDDVQAAVADDVDVGLVELPEAAPLGPLPPVDLADLEAAEGEGELVLVEGHVFGQGHRQVKAEGQVGVPLLEAVDLLLGLAAALGQQHLAGLDGGGVQGGEAVEGVALPEDGHHAVKEHLIRRQQLHEAGQGAGLDTFHLKNSFCIG